MLVPDLLEQGVLFFNKGMFYEAHEVWEDLWRVTTDISERTCYQGLIQAAVSLHHLSRGNEIGARSQLQKSIRNLQSGVNAVGSLDIGTFIGQLSAILETTPRCVPESLRIARLK
jgi:predicted metal-dependent hydrolase